jgi:hypothetical protein
MTDDQRAIRKKRLEALEGDIRRGIIARHRAILALKRVRDDGLYKELGHATWKAYLKAEHEWNEREVHFMIIEAERFFAMVGAAEAALAEEAKV